MAKKGLRKSWVLWLGAGLLAVNFTSAAAQPKASATQPPAWSLWGPSKEHYERLEGAGI